MTPFDIAQRFVGLKEVVGQMHNPQLMAMLKLDSDWPDRDEVPWCSAFVNYVCWLMRLPRSKSLMAQSWLNIGHMINIEDAKPGFDIVILDRLNGKGHVGFYAGHFSSVYILGGNQNDSVSLAPYKLDDVLGIRRLSLNERASK